MKLVRIDRNNNWLTPWFDMPVLSDDWTDDFSSKTGLNMWEDAKNVYVEVAVPGMKEDDVDVNLENGILTVRATKTSKESQKEEGVKVYSSSMKANYYYSTSLPSSVDTSSVKAELEDGILVVSVKKSEAAKPKKIEVKKKISDKKGK